MTDTFSHISSALVIEDHDLHAELAVALLKKIGIPQIFRAANGAEGLEMAWAENPDLVLCDVDMPEIDGMGVLRELPKLPRVPSVLLVSATGHEVLRLVERLAKVHNLDVIGVVEKPLEFQKLKDMLQAPPNLPSGRSHSMAAELTRPEIIEALHEGRFVPYFEPKIRREDGHCFGAEMLARLISADGRVIPPVRFIEQLERMNRIEEMTWSILDPALQSYAEESVKGWDGMLSINISPQMLSAKTLISELVTRTENYDITPDKIVLEITESAAVDGANDSTGEQLESLARLRLKSFRLSIDDFGTGYSSMAQISNMPISELKIDREFSMDAPFEGKARAICESSISLAKKIGLQTCAEGVESHAVFQLLYDLGADSFQGHLFNEPMPADEFFDWARNWNATVNLRRFYLETD